MARRTATASSRIPPPTSTAGVPSESTEPSMPPTPGYDPIGTVQQAITGLLSAQLPQFLAIGNRLFLSFATIVLVWHGIRLMFTWRHSGEHLYGFARLLLLIAFGDAMIAYYASPIPGIGSSFSSLITDQA